MKKTTVMNDVQKIQKVLEKYLGRRKASSVAVEISEAIHGETQHTHNGEVFFVHKDETGKLVLSMESSVKENVLAILNSYLGKDEAQDCIEHLNCETKDIEFETIKIPSSDSPIYAELIRHEPANNAEVRFIDNLKMAISKSVKEFEIFVNYPSKDNGKIKFVPGLGYCYTELEEIAKENGLRLGTKDERVLFLGWLITCLINEGWSEKDAWVAVCTDSKELVHYMDALYTKYDLEQTGSRRVAGKCNLANSYKVLARDEKSGGFWLAGGYGNNDPPAFLGLCHYYDDRNLCGVGWFVF